MKKLKKFENFINTDATIEITPQEIDERGERGKYTHKRYNVIYLIDEHGIEITGTLIPYGTGRTIDYEFEPDKFLDSESRKYWDNNWEDVEEEILNSFNDQ